MPKTKDENTREVTQYRVLTLYSNSEVVISKNPKKGEKKIVKRLAVAVFDTQEALDAYQNEQKTDKAHQSYEVGEDWVEFKPEQSRFSLPLNPEPNAPTDEAEGSDE